MLTPSGTRLNSQPSVKTLIEISRPQLKCQINMIDVVSPMPKSSGNFTKLPLQQKNKLLECEQSKIEPINFISNAIRD
jgi:hypothetical protein